MTVPTSRDVARVAGVSQSTVSYVMSGRRPISPEVRQRVEAAIEQLTYQPNAGARALASQRTQVIGLVVPFGPAADPTGLLPFIETIAGGVRAQDHDVLLVTADEGVSALTRLEGRSLCDAIVLMEVEARDPRVAVAASLRVPVILIGVPDDPRGLPCVDLDFEAAGRMAVEELTGAGHERIAVLGHPQETIDRRLNYVGRFDRGTRAAASEAGAALHAVAPVEPNPAGARAAVEAALGGPAPCTGLVVASSACVPLVLQALEQHGRRPGGDVSVVALCTDAAAEAARPPVTNVSLEPRDVSRRVVATLFELLDRDRPAQARGVELVRPRLTRRGTTTGPP